MSNLTQYTYPFDPTGTASTNKIIGERHVVSTVGSDYRLIIPKHGPYFKDSLVVKHVATGATLNPGTDYEHSLYFDALSKTEPYPSIFGGISLKTSDYDGATLELAEYQTVGGEHVLSESSIATILANMLQDPRTTRWDDVTYKPGEWTPDSHLTSLEETVGYGELVEVVRKLATTYTLQSRNLTQLMVEHMQSENDPHNVSARLLARMQTLEANVYSVLENINFIKSNLITLDGPTVIYQGVDYEWDITNWDSFSVYGIDGDFPGAIVEDKKVKVSIPFDYPSGNKPLIITRNGAPRELLLNINDRSVVQPKILFAYNNQVDVGVAPELTSSEYRTNPVGVDTLAEVQWQFAIDPGFQNILEDVTYTELGATLQDPLPLETTVYSRCRYRGTELSWSLWSPVIKFTTAAIEPGKFRIVGDTFGEDAQGNVRYSHGFTLQTDHYLDSVEYDAIEYIYFDEVGQLIHTSGAIANMDKTAVNYVALSNGVEFESDTTISVKARIRNKAGVWGPYSLPKYITLATRSEVPYVVTSPKYRDYTGQTRTAVTYPRPKGKTAWVWDDEAWPRPNGGEWSCVGSKYANQNLPVYTYYKETVFWDWQKNGNTTMLTAYSTYRARYETATMSGPYHVYVTGWNKATMKSTRVGYTRNTYYRYSES